MDSISEIEEWLDLKHRSDMSGVVADAADSLRAMGFELVFEPCCECMFVVRGGQLPEPR